MKKDPYYSIGQAAKICDISIQTLRYYDKEGLVKPGHVDAHSGYRFYSVQNLLHIKIVQDMRSMNFSLEEIGHALQREDAFGQAWHVPTADAVTTRQFTELAYRAAGHEPDKVKTFSRGTLRIVGMFIPAVKETIEMLYQFEEDFVMDTSKFTDRFVPTPLPVALRETVKGYRGQLS